MSQNKTIVEGSELAGKGMHTGDSFLDNLYRPSGLVSDQTCLNTSGGEINSNPEILLDEKPSEQDHPQGNVLPVQEAKRVVEMQDRLVVGVLYSISRGLYGEIFPLYLGRNMVGTAPQCDQRLSEDTVSKEHAVIYIRNLGPYEGYEVLVSDYGSKHGTTVNGEDTVYRSLKATEEDIISIGSHYQFIMKLFNTEAMGLTEDPGFRDSSESGAVVNTRVKADEHDQETIKNMASNDFYAPSGGDYQKRTIIG